MSEFFTNLTDVVAQHWAELFGGVSLTVVVWGIIRVLIGLILTKIETKAKLKANTGLSEKITEMMTALGSLDMKYAGTFKQYLTETQDTVIAGFKKALEEYQATKVQAYNKIMEADTNDLKEIAKESVDTAIELAPIESVVEEIKETATEINETSEKIEEKASNLADNTKDEEQVKEDEEEQIITVVVGDKYVE